MTGKIFRSIFLVATAALLAAMVIVMGALYEYFGAVERGALSDQTLLCARGVENEGMAYLEGLDAGKDRVTWVAADGTVLYDSQADAAAMENHAGREEIREALAAGTGESERVSATLAEKTLYCARRLADGTVLRLSTTSYTVFTLAMGMIAPVCGVLALGAALSAVLARRLSRRIVGPLAALDLEHPLDNDVYEELSPLLTRVEHLHRQVDSQMAALQRQRDEFAAVTGSMSEGLVLLNEQGLVLSINNAAARLFGADPACVGRDMLAVDRSPAMRELVSGALEGRRGEACMALSGGEYQVNSSPVTSDGRTVGACILAFDVTERREAERRRREFSANVSHELKTPLHSIMGSAELIENGLVRQEDLPRFAGLIRAESARLVALIEDIIRLSQLDEGVDLPRENTDLRALADEAVGALSQAAAERNVTLACEGRASVRGVRRLLYEIIYNLCDNAVKYNVPGGRADVRLSMDGDAAILSVSDTGIGIPPEDQPRVFERFYRVDKSHSKETGGTGLGLSIVRHAAEYHGAKIALESRVGKGTAITVRFPPQPEA